ncbi:hypothetical protein Hanom_Chr04g00308221 [Helianthus anomalus]
MLSSYLGRHMSLPRLEPGTSGKRWVSVANWATLVVLRKAAAERLMEKEKNKGVIYDFDRDYKDIGVVRFTIKYCVIKNCLPNAKSDTLLAAWNPPSEWGKKEMIRVDAKLGAPKDGASPIELFSGTHFNQILHINMSNGFFAHGTKRGF